MPSVRGWNIDPKGSIAMVDRRRHVHSVAVLLGVALLMILPGCSPATPNALDKLGSTTITIKGKPFRLWIADSADEQQRGLMFVPADQMTPLRDGTARGMIFVFDHDQVLTFWMKNTIIPLDIAYLDAQGKVVAAYTMPPFDERAGQYSSRVAARIAIEVNANTWSELGLRPGDLITIPATLLKR